MIPVDDGSPPTKRQEISALQNTDHQSQSLMFVSIQPHIFLMEDEPHSVLLAVLAVLAIIRMSNNDDELVADLLEKSEEVKK